MINVVKLIKFVLKVKKSRFLIFFCKLEMMGLIWGPLLHDILLFIASAYEEKPSEKQQESMLLCITHIFANLPCKDPCAIEATTYIEKNPIDVTSKDALLLYLVTFHNRLNATDGKKADWTVLEALAAAHARHGSSIRSLARADQVRVEDHKLIQDLIQENNDFREKIGLPWRRKENEKMDYDFSKHFKPYDGPESTIDISVFLIVVISMILFFVFIMAFISK
jgi:Erv1/Alr family protein